MDQSEPDPNFCLKEWALKARISRENTTSRRFSVSNLKSFREDAARSFRSNVTVSSTASSPGYTVREEIDPSTYSFTTALKALQAKTMYTWEYQSPEGLRLNSKWNDAERYICNPLSGEVPLECLSAKTLSGRSFRSVTSRITMSAPLIYPSNMHFHANSPISEHQDELDSKSKEEKRGTTRDVGTQSTPLGLSSSSPSPARTPSIEERLPKRSEGGDSSPVSSGQLKSGTEVEVKETGEKESRERKEGERKKETMCRCSNRQGGCLSLRGLWTRTANNRDKHKSRTKDTNITPSFIYQINGCPKK